MSLSSSEPSPAARTNPNEQGARHDHRLLWLTLVFAGATLLLLLALAQPSEASHFRYGTLSWEPTENENEALFTGSMAARSSFFSPEPVVGDLVDVGPLNFGDGTTATVRIKVEAVDAANDWWFGIIVDSAGEPGIRHQYSAPNNGGDPIIAFWQQCCRLQETDLDELNFHVNNPNGWIRLETAVDLANPPNSSPRTTLSPINPCPLNSVCTIVVPATDPDGEPLSFRTATAAEATGTSSYNQPGPPHAPHAAQIDASTGVITWNTTGATFDPDFEYNLYSMQVVIEDAETRAPLDFFIRLLPESTEQPYWVTPPSPCGEIRTASIGNPFSVDLEARSDDPARILTLGHLGLPTGATLSAPTPGNPALGTFSWTPTSGDLGSHIVVFTAQDDLGLDAPGCSVIIEVQEFTPEPPYFVAPSPCALAQTVFGTAGQPLSFDLTAQNDHGPTMVTLSLLTGPTGLTFSPGPTGNPTNGTANWPSPAPGQTNATFRATDSQGLTADCVVEIDIDNPPPVWTNPGDCTGTFTANGSQGAPLRFGVTAEHSIATRTITISVLDGPSGLGVEAHAAANPVNANITWDDPQQGTHAVTLLATDNEGATSECELTIDVANPPPTWTTPGDCTGTFVASGSQGVPMKFGVTAEHSIITRTVTISILDGPSGLEVEAHAAANPVNANITWDDPQAGSYPVTLLATDSEGATSACELTIEVDNPPPTWTNPGDCTGTFTVSGSQGVPMKFGVTAEHSIITRTVTISVLDGPSSLGVEAHAAANPVNANMTWDDPQQGTHAVTLLATDSEGATSECDLTIEVDNPPPTWTHPGECSGFTTFSGSQGVPMTFGVTAEHSTITRTVTISVLDGPSGLGVGTHAAANPVNANITWDDPQAGSHPVALLATDSEGATSECQLTIEVDNPPPTWTHPGDCTGMFTVSGSQGVPMKFGVTAEHSIITRTITISFIDGPSGLGVEAHAAANPVNANITWDDPQQGTHTVTLLATDSEGATSECDLTIEVDNPPPIWTIPGDCTGTFTVSGSQGVPLKFGVTAEHTIATRTITISVLHGPSGVGVASHAAANPVNANITWDDPQAGSHPVTLLATDSEGATSECDLTIEVDNPPPTWTNPGDCTGTFTANGSQGVPMKFGVTAEHSIITRTITIGIHDGPSGLDVEAHAAANPVNANITWNDPQQGTHAVTLLATDSEGATNECYLTIEVDNPPPTWTNPGNCSGFTTFSGSQGVPMKFGVTAEHSIITRAVTISVLDGPSGLGVEAHAAANPVNVNVTWDDPQAGSHPVTLLATDGEGASSECDLTIEVDNPPPTWTTPGDCTGIFVASGSQGVPMKFGVTAEHTIATRTITISVLDGPSGVGVEAHAAANPVNVNVTWDDPQAGSHPVTLLATDSEGATSECDLTIEVDNPPPTWTVPGDCTGMFIVSGSQGVPMKFGVTAEHSIITRTVTISVLDGPSGLGVEAHAAANPVNANITWGDPQQGAHPVTLLATDSEGASSECDLTIEVDNPPPTWTNPGDCSGFTTFSGSQGVPMMFGVTAEHTITTRTITISILDGPSGLGVESHAAANPVNVNVTWDDPQAGSHPVTLLATDSEGATSECDLTIEVDNPPPIWTVPGDCTGTFTVSGSKGVAMRFGVTAEHSIATRTVAISVLSGPTGVGVEAHAAANPVNTNITWSDPQAGTHAVTLLATDSEGTTSACDLTIEVDNPPPTWTNPGDCSGAFTVSGDKGIPIRFGVTAEHTIPTRSISISILSGPSGVGVEAHTAANPVTANVTWTHPQAGTHAVTLLATDSEGATSACDLTIEVDNPPPTWTIPGECTGSFTVSGSQGVPLSFGVTAEHSIATRTVTISVLSGPSGVGVESHAAANPVDTNVTWADPQAGTHAVTLLATDSEGATSACDLTIHVDNPPPIFTAPVSCSGGFTVTGTRGVPISFGVTAAHPISSRTVMIGIFAAPAGVAAQPHNAANPVSTNVTWPDPMDGTHQVVLEATDDEGQTAHCTVRIEVDNPPPVFTAPSCTGDVPIMGSQGVPLSFGVTAEHPIASRLITFSIASAPTGVLVEAHDPANPVNGTVRWADPEAGDHRVVVRATDSEGATAHCEILLDIDNPPPIFSRPVSCSGDHRINGQQGVPLGFGVTAEHPLSSRTISLSITSAPQGTTLEPHAPANPVASNVTWPDPQAGSHIVVVRATDSEGQTAECEIVLDIENDPPHFTRPLSCAGDHVVRGTQGTPVSFDVTAAHEIETRTITLNVFGIPGFVSPPPGNPVSANITWVDPQEGHHVVLVRATDSEGATAECEVQLIIDNPPPHFVQPPTCGGDIMAVGMRGTPLTYTVTAEHATAARTVRLSLIGGSTPLPTLAPHLPGNPVSANLTWNDPGPGNHTAHLLATDSEGQTALCSITVLIIDPQAQALSQMVYAGISHPESVEYQTVGVDRREVGTDTEAVVEVDTAPLLGILPRVQATVLHEQGTVAQENTNVSAHATATAAEVRLLDGLIVLEAIRNEARLEWDPQSGEHTLVADADIARLEVFGTVIPVDGTPQTIDLPGGGHLLLFPSESNTTGDQVTYRSRIAHLFLPIQVDPPTEELLPPLASYATANVTMVEIIVGEVQVRVGMDIELAGQERQILAPNDAGSGRDAGEDGEPITLRSGAYHAALPVGDENDTFSIPVEGGHSLLLALQPASRLSVVGGEVSVGAGIHVVPPATTLDMRDLTVRLIAPNGEIVGNGATTDGLLPALLFLDGTREGNYTLIVTPLGPSTAANYTLVVLEVPSDAVPLGGSLPPGTTGDPLQDARAAPRRH